MKFKTIRNCGKIGFEFREVNYRAKEFIKKLIEEAAKNCYCYFRETDDHLFTYNERQFNSAICPAISSISNCFVMQHPLVRKPRGEDSYQGRVDYWINYKNRDFLLELKYDYRGYLSGTRHPKSIENKFNKALE